MPEQSIHTLINQIALHDDQDCLQVLYYRFFDQLFKHAQSIIHSAEESEEIVNDAFLSIWNNRKQLIEVRNFKVYIYTIVRNKSLNALARRNAGAFIERCEPDAEQYVGHHNADDKLLAAEMADILNHSIEKLPARSRLIFRLVKENGFKHREAAELLDLSVKSIEYHMGNALKKIWESFTALYDAAPEKNVKNNYKV